MHRHTWWPKSSTERSTPILAQHRATRRRRHGSASNSEDRSTGDEAARADGGSIDEPELHLGEEVLVPDLAGWRRERMPELPATAYFTLAPDWVCEVLSASTRKVDLQGKRPIYAAAGVAHLWLIDPVDCTLEAFELLDGRWLLIASAQDDAPVNIRPFDAITFSLGELWD